jgi:hypothetical protein
LRNGIYGVKVNIVGDIERLTFIFNQDTLEFSLKEWSYSLVLFIEIHGVPSSKLPHKVSNPMVPFLPKKKVVVVVYKAVGEYLYKFIPTLMRSDLVRVELIKYVL